MKTRILNEECLPLCKCSPEVQEILEENKEKCLSLKYDGTFEQRSFPKNDLNKTVVYQLTIEEPETIREWLATLPKEYEELALKRNAEHEENYSLDEGASSLKGAVNLAMCWRDTSEGRDFWKAVAHGKLPPIPKTCEHPNTLNGAVCEKCGEMKPRTPEQEEKWQRLKGKKWAYIHWPSGRWFKPDGFFEGDYCYGVDSLLGRSHGFFNDMSCWKEYKETKLIPYDQTDYEGVVQLRNKSTNELVSGFTVTETKVYFPMFFNNIVTSPLELACMPDKYELPDGTQLLKEVDV